LLQICHLDLGGRRGSWGFEAAIQLGDYIGLGLGVVDFLMGTSVAAQN
jgi:hypothetical protein